MLLAAAVAPTAQQRASGDTVQLTASKDNTLYENAAGSSSNGVGPTLYAGKTGTNNDDLRRRAVLAFDLAAIPAGSTIESASLRVQLTRAPGGAGSITEDFSLHALLADWGQAASNAGSPGGAGAPAVTGDATWVHRFYNTTTWATPGGDYDPAVSGSQSLAGPGAYTFNSPQLAADVQAWLDDPAGNFGWMLRGNEALVDGTLGAKEFASREHATTSFRPTLTVTYAIPEPAALAPVLISALALIRRRSPSHATPPAPAAGRSHM
jgi:hypothetical protein